MPKCDNLNVTNRAINGKHNINCYYRKYQLFSMVTLKENCSFIYNNN